jgi:hypothetical protein
MAEVSFDPRNPVRIEMPVVSGLHSAREPGPGNIDCAGELPGH